MMVAANKKLSPPIRGHMTTDSHNYKKFCHSELQKCHCGLKMLAQWRERVD